MNHIYRLCWNRVLRQWVAASELALSKRGVVAAGHIAGRRLLMFSMLSAALGMTSLAHAGAAPSGGQVVSGSARISHSGTTTTIKQNSNLLSLNWQNFDIGADQTVNFLQPGASSIAVNRILGNTATQIYGHLNANGQVWLINPNGVLFGHGAQVNVGGIVASTLDLDTNTFGSSSVRFAGNGKGSVTNHGTISAANGGYVTLIGNQVSNQGVIRAQLGTVALAGGTEMTLTFADNHLVHLVVDANTVRSLVENRQLIVADGGQVLMTAGGRNSLIDSQVNNTGTVQAQTVQNHNGIITLLGGMQAGTVNVGGTLDASAPNGGNGGQIETSGAHFTLAGDANITAASASGNGGTWLVDPFNLTIDSAAANTISTTLNGGTNVTEATTATGASGIGNPSAGAGDINVNAGISWNSAATLTLNAFHNINLGAAITNSGGGKTVLTAGNAFVNTAGAAALGGHWTLYSVNPTANALGGLTADFAQYNATPGTSLQGTGNGLLYSVKPTLTISGLAGAVQKGYDGSASAALAGSNVTYTGLINGDSISSATGAYSQSDVGTGLTVTSPSSIAGFTILNGVTPIYGYTLSGASRTANIGQIAAAQLYATIIGNPTKVYDGTTTATLSSANYYITGLATGQSVTVNQPSSVGYASPNVNTNGGTTPGGGKVAVDATFASTNFVVGSGTKLSNYLLPTTTSITSAALAQDATAGYGIITPAPVQLSGVLTTNKTYDRTTADTLDTSNANIYGVLDTDAVTLDKSSAVGIFASANAGSNIAIALSGFTLVDTTDSASVAATKVANYQLIVPTNLKADIARYALTVSGIAASNKIYDGTATDTLNISGAQLSPALSGDSVHLTTGTATGVFSQSDVGTGLAVTVNGLITDNSNYIVSAPSGLTANITPRELTIAFSGSADKIYDGTNYATLSTGNFTVGNFVAGQSVSVNQAPAVYSGTGTPNVGTSTVTATLQSSDLSFTGGAKAGNYTFNSSVVGSGLITPAPLMVAINGNPTRTYNGVGDTSATLTSSNFTLSGVIPGESITLNGATAANYYDTTNGAAPNPASYEGNAGVWGVVAALTDGNFTANGSTLLSNYALPALALGYGTITRADAGVGYLVTDVTGSRIYDGTNVLNILAGSTNLVLGGLKTGDMATLTSNVTGNFASKNVGSQPLTVTNLLASDFTFTSGLASNYTFPETVTGTGTITAKPLTVSIIGNPTKTYNGSTAVLPLSSSNFHIADFVNGEGATINPTASFAYATANAGASGSDAITGKLTQNNYVADSGTLLSNYTLDYAPTGYGTINKADLYVTGVYASNKVYNTTNAATVNMGNGQLAGLADVDKNHTAITLTVGNTTPGSIAGDGTVTGSAVAGTFASSDAGNGQVVSTTFSLDGTSANNYNLVTPGLTADITRAPLTIAGIVAHGKVYDGTTTATFGDDNNYTFNVGSATLSGFAGSDNTSDVALSAAGTTGTFSMANVGSNLSVTGVNGFSLNAGTVGDKSNNYYVVQPTGLTAGITPRPLSVAITGNPTKVYDGTNSATLVASDYTIGAVSGNPDSGWVAGQGATLPQSATANYASADVMGVNGSAVNSTLVSPDWKVDNASTLLSNYILPISATGLGTITPLVLNLSATRVYDTTNSIYSSISGNVTNADDANVFGTLNGLNGDQFTVTGAGTTSSKNVGTYTADFSLGTLALVAGGSALSSNYTLVGGTDTYTISKAPLNINGASVTPKVYDGNTTATVTGATLASGNTVGEVLSGDNVVLSGDAGTFNSKNVGTGKVVTINGGNITGTDAGNYVIVQPAGLVGTINARPVTISGVRVYNGLNTVVGGSGSITWAVPGGVAGNTSSGVVSGDTVKVTGGNGSTASANVGTYNSDSSGNGLFTAAGLTLNNSNYVIAATENQFKITPYVINFTGSNTYTGSPTVTVGAGSFLNGSNIVSTTDETFATGVNGETLTLNGPYTLANSGNAGTNTTSASGLTLAVSGANTGNASNYQIGTVKYVVSPYVLSFSGSRNYDGTKNVIGSDLRDATTGSSTSGSATFTGVNGDTYTVSGTGSLSSANKGSYGGNTSGVTGAPTGTTQIGVSGLTLVATSGSGLASNYTFVGGKDTYDINAQLVTITGERVYNGVTDANGVKVGTSWVFNGVTSGDQSNVSVAGTGSVSSADIGTYGYGSSSGGTFDYAGLSLAGSAASNYTLGTDNTFIIDPYVINLSGSRAYNGSSSVAITAGNFLNGTNVVSATDGTFATGVNGETLTLDGPYALSSKNAGTTNVTLNAASGDGLSFAGSTAGNYIIGTVDYTVNKAVLNLSGTRAYDGTTDAQASAFGSNGVLGTGIGTETVNLSGTGLVGDKNVGTGKPFTGLGSLALADGGNGGLGGNYTLVGGTDALTITPKHIDATVTAENKVYDATDTATVAQFGSTGASGIGTGVISGDTVSFADTGATFSDANAANGKTVTVSGIAANGVDAGNYVLDNSTAATTADITPYVLGLTGQRVYDATTNAYGTGFDAVTGLSGDAFTVSGSGSVSSKNVDTYSGIGGSTFGLGNLVLVSGGTALASNYTLVGGTDEYTITPFVLNLTSTRVYDGATDAAASLFGNGVLTGVNGEMLTLGGSGTLSSKNVGTQQPFASNGLSAFTLTGNGPTLASNYTLTGGTDWVTITPLSVTVGATGKDKTYDGTTTATVTLGSSGLLAGDTVNFGDGSANFNSPNAGTGVPIAVNGIIASGADAGNYTFNTTASTSATINPYALGLTGTRVYDATVGTYGADFGTVSGFNGDTFTVSGTGLVSSKNVGTYNGVGGSSFALGNLALVSGGTALAGNYTLTGGTDKYTITPATLTVAGTTVDAKTYDGTITASLGGSTLTGVLGGDTVTLGNDTTGTFVSPNAGTQGVTTGVTIGGVDAGNYLVVQPTGLTGIINPYVLGFTGTRVYDATTNAYGNDLGLLTGLNGDTFTVSGSGSVSSKNVGTYSGVGGSSFALGNLVLVSGGAALTGNYTLVGGTDVLSITPKTIAVDATGTNKMYDGNTLDIVTLASGGVVTDDSVQFGYGSANFADPDIGSDKVVTVTGVQLSGADAGNYLLSSPTVYSAADITGAQASAFGISNGILASLHSATGPTELATPYGLAPQDTVGAFIGNKKRLHHPVERNVSRRDFTSGLALKVIDGGLRVPALALP